jgi:hypothetical protein
MLQGWQDGKRDDPLGLLSTLELHKRDKPVNDMGGAEQDNIRASHAKPEKECHRKARLRSNLMMALEGENVLFGPGVEALVRIRHAFHAFGRVDLGVLLSERSSTR